MLSAGEIAWMRSVSAICWWRRMAWDIHSYLEVRDGAGEPWELVQHARIDEDGRFDVPDEEQPFGALRSSSFFAVLTGIISVDVDLDYRRLVPLVPADRPTADDLSAELERIYGEWEGDGTTRPFWLDLADLEATDWTRPIYTEDGTAQPLRAYAGAAGALILVMRELRHGRRNVDVRLVFWLDS